MFDSAAGLGKIFRSEVIPMLKSKGFNINYINDNPLIDLICKNI